VQRQLPVGVLAKSFLQVVIWRCRELVNQDCYRLQRGGVSGDVGESRSFAAATSSSC